MQYKIDMLHALDAQLYFLKLFLMRSKFRRIYLKIKQNAVISWISGTVFQFMHFGLRWAHKVMLAWTTSGCYRVLYVISFYRNMATASSQQSESFESLKQPITVFKAGSPLLRPDGLGTAAGNGPLRVDAMIWFLCYPMLEDWAISSPTVPFIGCAMKW